MTRTKGSLDKQQRKPRELKESIINITEKLCKMCQIIKSIDNYYKAGKYYDAVCKSCKYIQKQRNTNKKINILSVATKFTEQDNEEKIVDVEISGSYTVNEPGNISTNEINCIPPINKCLYESINKYVESQSKLRQIALNDPENMITNDTIGIISIGQYNEDSMRIYPREFDVLVVRGSKGVGKTVACIQWLKNLPDFASKRIGCVSFRKTLTTNLVSRFNKDLGDEQNRFYDYQEIEEHAITQLKWVCQLESLDRIKTLTTDVLIIDEFNQVINQIFSNTVRSQSLAFNKLRSIIRNAKKLILMDADLNKTSIENIMLLRGQQSEITYINNTYTQEYNLTFVPEEQRIMNMMRNDLIDGKRIVVATNRSIETAMNLKKMLSNIEDLVPLKKGQEKKAIIKKNVLLICKETENTRKLLKDVNNTWSQYDAIIYTPTIQSGVSFEREHFDNVYGLFVNLTNSAQDASQMLHRVRCLRGQFYVNIKTIYSNPKPVNRNEIEQYIQQRDNMLNEEIPESIEIIEDESKGINIFPNKNDLYTMWISYVSNVNKSRNDFMAEFIKCELIQGAIISVAELEEQSMDKLKKHLADIKVEVKHEINDAKIASNDKTSYIRKVYCLADSFEITEEFLNEYGARDMMNKYQNLKNMYTKGLYQIKLESQEYKNKNKLNSGEIDDSFCEKYHYIKHKICDDLIKICQFNSIFDTEQVSAEGYSDVVLPEFNKYCTEKWALIRGEFGGKNKVFKPYGDLRYVMKFANRLLDEMYGLKIQSMKNNGSMVGYSLNHSLFGSVFPIDKDQSKPFITASSIGYVSDTLEFLPNDESD